MIVLPARHVENDSPAVVVIDEFDMQSISRLVQTARLVLPFIPHEFLLQTETGVATVHPGKGESALQSSFGTVGTVQLKFRTDGSISVIINDLTSRSVYRVDEDRFLDTLRDLQPKTDKLPDIVADYPILLQRVRENVEYLYQASVPYIGLPPVEGRTPQEALRLLQQAYRELIEWSERENVAVPLPPESSIWRL